jgi:uncharacterized protein (TIGR03118 family)
MKMRVRSNLGFSPRCHAKRRFAYAPSIEALGERCLLSGGYLQSYLVSDIPGLARYTDPNLVNPWGLTVSPGAPFWLGDNGPGFSAVDTGDGQGFPAGAQLVVAVPGLPGGRGSVTGQAFNGGGGFNVSEDGNSGSSIFLFATEQGIISGWSPTVDMWNAVPAVDSSSTPGLGPIYTGLAVATNSQGTFLFAANFRSGTIDVFDQAFNAVHWQGAFQDPALPRGFSPFNIQEIGTTLYVTYTEQNDGRYDEGTGTGNGLVDAFDTNGHLLQRFVNGGPLNEPWGIAQAPDDFGQFSGDLLVGNFGDGHINAFNPQSGAFLGALTDTTGQPIILPGLWGLSFGNDGPAGPSNALYFTAGIGDEYHGLFGSLQPSSGATDSGDDLSKITNAVAGAGDQLPEGDDYPLPPGFGPALQQTPTPVQQLPVAFLPVNGSSLAIVPTLSAAAGAQGSSNATVTAQTSPLLGQGLGPILISIGTSTGPDTAFDAFNDGIDPTGQQSAAPTTSLTGFFGGPRFGEGHDNVMAVSPVDNTSLGCAAFGKKFSRPISPSIASLHTSSREDRELSLPGVGEDRAVTLATIGPPLRWNNLNQGWLVRAAQYTALVLLAGCGIRYAQTRQRLREATVTSLKSFWSRFTRRSLGTVPGKSTQLAYAELAVTRVTDVTPESWEQR